jgi:hypothetical protein
MFSKARITVQVKFLAVSFLGARGTLESHVHLIIGGMGQRGRDWPVVPGWINEGVRTARRFLTLGSVASLAQLSSFLGRSPPQHIRGRQAALGRRTTQGILKLGVRVNACVLNQFP